MNKHLHFLLWGLLWLFLFLPSLALSQNNNSNSEVSINVSAQVISSIEMITIQSMNLSQAENDNDRITIDPQNSSNAGKMIAIGTPNSDIRISYLEQRELTRRQGSETLIFNYQIAGNTEDDQSTAELLNRENRDFEFNEQGQFYLWIGGNVDISTATPGNYEGEFTVDIEYI
ncbi:hypothetical protein [Fodinibius sp. Rm-B-1B1-1]|uniref:hypothetical protein n=1 Tax=Fodinibius alkaliphilus TaxID=3140241 RepID=UPI003159C35C